MMNATPALRGALALTLGATTMFAPSTGSAQAQNPTERVAQAARDWNAGRYDVALSALAEVLRAPGTDAALPAIAKLTGEPYRTVPVSTEPGTPTWRPRWASDNTHIAWETGTGANVRTHIGSVGDQVRTIATVNGRGLVFSSDARRVAYLAGDQVRTRLVAGGAESEVPTGGIAFTELAFAASGGVLYGVGRQGDNPAQIHSWTPALNAAPTALTTSDSTKSDLLVVPGGRYLVYSVRAGAPVGGARGNVAGGGASFEVFDVTTRTARRFAGRNVVVARDGGALAFLAGGGGGGGRGGGRGAGGRGGAASEPTTLMRLSLAPLGEPQAVFATGDAVASPAISPDGRRVAFQMMPREDWDLYTVVADSAPVRLTHDIQHDLTPRFLSNTTLLGLMGEARHRRSHVYDVATGERTKIFHNNSVRTIAPEYEWVPSPDGRKVLIVAERDGDTVTPHRFLYCTDLSRPVTRAELVSRVDSALTAERGLREFAARSFQPIEAAVRDAVDDVDVGRIYEYARTLYSFGSKYITQPGNAKAREYLLGLYRSFGYDARFQPFETPAPGGGGGGGRGGRGGGPGSMVETANVIAVLPGTENPELVYVVGSHFDSVQPGPGADDNSSGTTALLEAARVLAQRPQAATIMFVSFTGEEAGLRGSREFVRQAQRDSMKLVGALNNDMIGFANDERLDNTIRYSNSGIKDIQHAAALRFTNLITYDAFYYKSTDAAAFYDAYGDIVGGIGSYPVLGNPHYHQSHDELETINHRLVAEVSKTTVGTLMYLASSPSRLNNLRATRSGSAVDVTWTPSPEKSVVRYIVRYGQNETTVTEPRARLTNVPAGTMVQVKAVNSRGLEGWDWARVTVQ